MNEYIQDAFALIRGHPRISNVEIVEDESNSTWIIKGRFDVELPSTWKAQGESPYGVRAFEDVWISFPAAYPNRAPVVSLRADFNPNVPHLNYYRSGDRVQPCVAHGDLLEIIHSEGIGRLLFQIFDWLEKAAYNKLIDKRFGWEPTRRVRGGDEIHLNVDQIVGNAPKMGGLQHYCVTSFGMAGEAPLLARLPQLQESKRIRPEHISTLLTIEQSGVEGVFVRLVPLSICWPLLDANGEFPVFDIFRPDNIYTLEQLRQRAQDYSCDISFDSLINSLTYAVKQRPSVPPLPVFVVLPVLRPFPLIGQTTPYELLAYRIDVPIPGGLDNGAAIKVQPVTIFDTLSVGLLRRTSGLDEKTVGVKSTFIGCGSLGSKVAMHMARCGFSPDLLIDQGNFAPHNSARHVLYPDNAFGAGGKAQQLSRIISQYQDGKVPRTYSRSVQDFTRLPIAKHSPLNDPAAFAVNTTASNMVRQCLSESDFPARIIEACALDLGESGLMTIEGSARNPSTSDLMARAYEELRQIGKLKVGQDANRNQLRIGVGCNSVTLPMSDSRISLIAAGVAQSLTDIHKKGLPDSGLISIASLSADAMSINWVHTSLAATQIADLSDTGRWRVRVLDSAHKKIASDVASHSQTETGGLIVGRVSTISREIYIVDVLPAPPDSTRQSSLFVLGTEGFQATVAAYDKSGQGALWCIGTWHSHLGAFGPSQMDIDTADQLVGKIKGAAVLLIHRPDGYSAVVREDVAA
ncbi:Conserved hypothetical protein [Herminiimonas arsenicoxydans]|uniref:Uncharacterized protein n=1 Tax=Herminiimonas arsenicoxydans TaxID=204773 RepID=A4G9X2_HERAR|nr:Conserved hypothetical protein [Herminiimonas arsenicoxydans]